MMKVCLPHDCAQWKFRKIINGHKPKEKNRKRAPNIFSLACYLSSLIF